MYRSHNCGELRAGHIGEQVSLAGWVQIARNLGGMTFIDLRDRYGITQLAFNMEENEALCQQARKAGREYVIQISGIVGGLVAFMTFIHSLVQRSVIRLLYKAGLGKLE